MYDPEGVWKRRIILAVVAAVVILAAGGTGFLLASGGNEDDGNNAQGPSPSAPAEDGQESSSVCGLPDGEQEVPSIGPDAEWEPVDDFLAPRTEEFGPGEESGNIHSCFARNPTGALMAATVFLADRNNVGVDQVELARTRYAQTGGYEDNLRDQEEGSATDAPAGSPTQVAGFRFTDYNSDRAVVEVVMEVTNPADAATVPFVGVNMELRWIDGDWLAVLPETGDFDATQPQELSQYVVWAAAPNPDGAGDIDEDGAPSAQPQPTTTRPLVSGGFGTSAVVFASGEADEDDGALCTGVADCLIAGAKITSPGLGAAGALASRGAGAAASGIAGSALEEFAASAQEAAEQAIKELLTAWLRYPDPNVSGGNSVAVWLQANLSGLAVFVVVGAVILSSIRLVTTQRFEHMRELGGYLIRVLLVAGLTTVVVTLGLEIGDDTAGFLLDQADVDLVSGAGGLFGFTGMTNPVLLILVALVVLLVQIIQFALMVVRGAVVVLLAGVLPFLAATSSTSTGKLTYQKAIGYLLAWVLYKPVAAVIYIVAIRLTNGDQDIASQISGLGLMVLAIIALPALLRVVAPATGAMGGASGGGLAMAGIASGVATGAVLATGGAAAAGTGAAGVSSAPIGASMGSGGGPGGGGAGGGPAGGGSGPLPGGSQGARGSDGADASSQPTQQPTLQPVGAGVGSAGGGPGSAGRGDTTAARYDETGGPGGTPPPGAPARGAPMPAGGNESSRSFGDVAGGASRGAQAAGGAGRAAGGAVGGPGGWDEEQEGGR